MSQSKSIQPVSDAGGSLTVDGAVSVTGTVTANAGSGTQAVSAASLPLPTGAATDGTDITTPTAMPAGGAGIRGWLSAIWTKLNGTLAVSMATNTPDVTDRSARQLGHVTVDTAPTTAVTGPLTDTQLRATAVPVSGTVTANAGSGTMAVSVASLPLPTGAALDATLTGGTQQSKLVDASGVNLASVSTAGALKVDSSAVTQPVSLATDIPELILAELQRISLILAVMADNYVTDEDLPVRN